ncbi:hypothetical protein HWV62_44311 [Athelia sp. TMB]|nr:hypothetical protein HWV62_44311 [Athelia sp. TMB]
MPRYSVRNNNGTINNANNDIVQHGIHFGRDQVIYGPAHFNSGAQERHPVSTPAQEPQAREYDVPEPSAEAAIQPTLAASPPMHPVSRATEVPSGPGQETRRRRYRRAAKRSRTKPNTPGSHAIESPEELASLKSTGAGPDFVATWTEQIFSALSHLFMRTYDKIWAAKPAGKL